MDQRLARRAWHAELAWLPVGVEADVLIEAVGDRFTAVTPGVPASAVPAGAARLAGLTLPGLANAHSHAFHRALRGATQSGRGTFWTWRDRMYEVAGAPDAGQLPGAGHGGLRRDGPGRDHLRRRVPLPAPRAGGAPYADPNEMGQALIEAAGRAGLRI